MKWIYCRQAIFNITLNQLRKKLILKTYFKSYLAKVIGNQMKIKIRYGIQTLLLHLKAQCLWVTGTFKLQNNNGILKVITCCKDWRLWFHAKRLNNSNSLLILITTNQNRKETKQTAVQFSSWCLEKKGKLERISFNPHNHLVKCTSSLWMILRVRMPLTNLPKETTKLSERGHNSNIPWSL